MVFAAPCPDAWPNIHPSEAGPLAPGKTRNFLDEDFCVVNGEHFFVRCCVQLPIVGAEEMFELSLWSSLSEKNFKLYFDTFGTDAQRALGPWFGWLSNAAPGYPNTFCLPGAVIPRDGGLRPMFELEPGDHPLAIQQRLGVAFDQILDCYAAAGHDIRPSLGAQ